MQDASQMSPEPEPVDGVAAEGGDDIMYCTDCGTKNPADAKFCKHCGHRVDRPPKLSEDAFADMQAPEARVSDLLVVAFKKHESGDLVGAAEACEKALEIQPESTSAHSLMGMLYEKLGERDRAIAEFQKVLELNPGSIADREKLELLKHTTLRVQARKVTSTHRTRGPVLFDSPTGAAVAAVAVFLLVLLVGAFAMLLRNQQVSARSASNLPATGTIMGSPMPQPNPALVQQQPAQSQSNAGQFNPYAAATSPQQNAQQNPPVQQRPRLDERRDTVPPATVMVPQADPLERMARGAERSPGNTIHLPDNNGLAQSELGPAPGQTNRNQNQNAGPQAKPNSGKIEIVISSDNNSGRASSGEGPSSMDSRSRRAGAQQAQLQGRYREAIKEYLKALDGAGDDAANIQQQIGLCYQRLDEKESAVSHYNDAIAEYKKLIAAGKNVDAANRGIKACENGIRVCQ